MIRVLWRYRLIRWSVRLITVFLLLTVVPIMPWRPANCANGEMIGNYARSTSTSCRSVHGLSRWLDEYHVHYWRLGKTIFLRVLPLFDGTDAWSRYGVFINAEWKVAETVMHDVTIGLDFHRTPEAVKRIEAEPLSAVDDDAGKDRRFCALFRVAVLEDPEWKVRR